MSWTRSALTVAALFLFLAGCASSAQKQRKEQRDKLVQSAKLYCEFLNGEQYPDIDVALNVQMAQRCDSDKTFSITSYKTPSEIPGVMFCCATAHKNAPAPVREKQVERVTPVKTAPPSAIAKPADVPAPSVTATATAGGASATATTTTTAPAAPKTEKPDTSDEIE